MPLMSIISSPGVFIAAITQTKSQCVSWASVPRRMRRNDGFRPVSDVFSRCTPVALAMPITLPIYAIHTNGKISRGL